jgi:hypothetical protein
VGGSNCKSHCNPTTSVAACRFASLTSGDNSLTPTPALLLHEIFPSGDVMLVLLLMVLAICIAFAFIGVFVARRYGTGGLAVSTVGFCLLVLIGSTTVSRDLGEFFVFPIVGGFAQATVIALRTRSGRGGSMLKEALIGGAVFVAGMIAAGIVAAIVSNS